MVEFSRRFAQSIVHQISGLLQTSEVNSFVLVAEPQILGLLREAIAPVVPKQVALRDLAKNLCALKSREIHDYLAKRDLLPAYKALRLRSYGLRVLICICYLDR